MHKMTTTGKRYVLNKLDLAKHPEIIELLNDLINSGEIAEVKKERGRDGNPTIAVVKIRRNLIYPPKA